MGLIKDVLYYLSNELNLNLKDRNGFTGLVYGVINYLVVFFSCFYYYMTYLSFKKRFYSYC